MDIGIGQQNAEEKRRLACRVRSQTIRYVHDLRAQLPRGVADDFAKLTLIDVSRRGAHGSIISPCNGSGKLTGAIVPLLVDAVGLEAPI